MTVVEHSHAPEEIMALLDGELTFERAAVVRSHLTSCETCRRVAEELSGVSRELSSWRLTAPPAMTAPVFSANEPPRFSRSRFAWWSFVTARTLSVSAVAALAIIVMLGRFSGRESRPPLAGAVALPLGGVEKPAEAVPPRTVMQSPAGPMIARTARIHLLTNDFDASRLAIDRIVRDHDGIMGQVDVDRGGSESRLLRATVRVPSTRLEDALKALRALGEVIGESQGADDVTEQAIDLEARLTNHRNTEKRLNDLLLKRTGELADVLAAEREVARVREEIERLDAQRKNLDRRVSYAAITLQVNEQRKATLGMGPVTASARFYNAFVDGFRGAVSSLLEASLIVVRVAPVLLLWTLVLYWPARLFLRWTKGVHSRS
jgi:hypothetical protein